MNSNIMLPQNERPCAGKRPSAANYLALLFREV
jgi:hypothetical protein